MTLFKELFKIYLLFIALFFLGRLGLYCLYFDRLSSALRDVIISTQQGGEGTGL